MPESVVHRPVPSRRAHWAITAALWLQRAGVRPNQISVLGLIVAALAAACLVLAGRSEDGLRIALLLTATAGMPLRLLCNVLDGKLAVEFDLKAPSGPIYSEFPDRLSDPLLLVGAGYAIGDVTWGPQLGWAAATTALLVAYVRILGVAAGAAWHFEGPMAKPHRMFVLIVACLLSAVATAFGYQEGWLLAVALALVIAGGIGTIARRLRLIAMDLNAA